MITVIALWVAITCAIAVAILACDHFHVDPRPVCFTCDQPRPARHLLDGVCVVCRAAAPARTQMPADIDGDRIGRRALHLLKRAAQAHHREDLRRQRAGLRALLAEVEDQIEAESQAVTQPTPVARGEQGGTR